MLSFPASVKIYLATGVTDMRKSFDGLSAMARQVLEQDPLSGHVFVFANRRRDRIKILTWDRSGYWLFAKRLERGTFPWPSSEADEKGIILSNAELAALLGGLDMRKAKRPAWLDVVA